VRDRLNGLAKAFQVTGAAARRFTVYRLTAATRYPDGAETPHLNIPDLGAVLDDQIRRLLWVIE